MTMELKTPLYDCHVALEGRMVPFAGYVLPVQYPTGVICRNFGVMIEADGLAERGTFVVNPQGRVVIAELHDGNIGRDARELLRKVQAAQYVAANPSEVCPAKWRPGEKTLTPSAELVGKL